MCQKSEAKQLPKETKERFLKQEKLDQQNLQIKAKMRVWISRIGNGGWCRWFNNQCTKKHTHKGEDKNLKYEMQTQGKTHAN